MDKKLPIFDIILNDEDLSQGVGRISLVDEPAIGVDWITLRKQPKMVIAKRECLGCPPNGDGTRVNGEPDGRCKGDGGGKESGGKGTVSKVEPTDRIKEIDDEVKTLEKSLNGTDADIQKWGDKLEKELGIKGDEKDKAARSFAEQENKQRLSSLLKEKKDLEDEIELDNWAKSLENEIGISADKSMQIVRPFPESQKIFEEEKTKLRKQTFAKRECLGCPPNGDGTRANGEPDRRCKDTSGGEGASSTSNPRTPSGNVSEDWKKAQEIGTLTRTQGGGDKYQVQAQIETAARNSKEITEIKTSSAGLPNQIETAYLTDKPILAAGYIPRPDMPGVVKKSLNGTDSLIVMDAADKHMNALKSGTTKNPSFRVKLSNGDTERFRLKNGTFTDTDRQIKPFSYYVHQNAR